MSVAADFAALGSTGTLFGRKEAVDPVSFLIGSAAGWGGNPPEAAESAVDRPGARWLRLIAN